MISAFFNSFKVPELKSRILFTLAMIVIVRIGTAITLPGVDPEILSKWIESRNQSPGSGAAAVAALLNVFSGGGLENCAIFALGIMPYISASIMLQLLTAVVPSLSKMAREEGGRQKITQYTRVATIVLCVVQGYMLLSSLKNPGQNFFMGGLDQVIREHGELVPHYGWGFIFTGLVTITAGTMLMMWLGEMITERGIGNGVSILICVNIVNALPGALVQIWRTYVGGENANATKAFTLVLLVGFMIAVIAGVVALTQAQRRIVIQYAKRVVGRKVYGGQTQYLPLKINYSGVMPIIFAQAILMFPSQIIGWIFRENASVQRWLSYFSPGHWIYYVLSAALIFFFSYFWVATMFQPQQISEDLKKAGGYIPGIRPGKPTADFLDFTMSRLTFAGAIFLTIIYALPTIVTYVMQIPANAAQFFGGTSLLILVGVVLDVMRQVETQLLQSHYDGFLRKGRIRGRFDRMQQTGKVASATTVVWMWVGIAVITLIGVAYFLMKK